MTAPKATATCMLLFGTLSFTPHLAHAEDRCSGPAACCPSTLAEPISSKAAVSIGVVLAGLYNVAEKSGTWDADYYLYERWTPTPGFTPQTEVVNEVTRRSEQFDETELRNGFCMRTRRIYSTLHNRYDLRRFPFDRQQLVIQFSDADYDARQVTYAKTPYLAGLTQSTRESLSSWKIESDVSYAWDERAFAWEEDAPIYDYATFTLRIRRHVTYHMTKFFLPLFIIVALAFLVFWIDPEDLASQVQIGVTCVLSAIAFQFVQTGSLPEVAYTTLTDRVYVVCYLAIAFALGQAVHANGLVRRGKKASALASHRICRWAYPATTAAVLAVVAMWSFHQG